MKTHLFFRLYSQHIDLHPIRTGFEASGVAYKSQVNHPSIVYYFVYVLHYLYHQTNATNQLYGFI